MSVLKYEKMKLICVQFTKYIVLYRASYFIYLFMPYPQCHMALQWGGGMQKKIQSIQLATITSSIRKTNTYTRRSRVYTNVHHSESLCKNKKTRLQVNKNTIINLTMKCNIVIKA